MCLCSTFDWRLTLDDGRWRLVRRYGTGLSARGALVTRFPEKLRTFSINARSRIMAASGITNNTLEVNRYKVQLGVKLVSYS